MAADGLFWFTDPGVIGQKMSVAANSLGTQMQPIVEYAAQQAENIIRNKIVTGGLGEKMSRIESGDMLDSVDSKTFVNGRDRVQGEFGYINNAPEYTKYQEYGTATTGWGKGIQALDAMNDAMTFYEDYIDQHAPAVLENVWEGLWS